MTQHYPRPRQTRARFSPRADAVARAAYAVRRRALSSARRISAACALLERSPFRARRRASSCRRREAPRPAVVGEQRVEDRVELRLRAARPRPARRPRSGGRGCAASGRRCRAGTCDSSPASKTKSAAVLEEAAEHAAHADRLAQARRRRAGACRCRARRSSIFGARLRTPRRAPRSIAGSVSALTFMPDPRALARRGRLARPRGSRSTSRVAQVERRDEQLAEPLRPAEAGEVVEEVGDVGGDLLVGREEAEVLVEPRGRSRGSCRCRCGRSGAARRPRGGRRASSSRGSSGRGSRRRRGRPPARARATTRCCGARRSAPSARRGRRSACPSSAASISAGTSGESSLVR